MELQTMRHVSIRIVEFSRNALQDDTYGKASRFQYYGHNSHNLNAIIQRNKNIAFTQQMNLNYFSFHSGLKLGNILVNNINIIGLFVPIILYYRGDPIDKIIISFKK